MYLCRHKKIRLVKIPMVQMAESYIRPLYTCGAFNREAQRAVMYNTARGTCYTFDGVSALLVSEVLKGGRACPVGSI